MDMHKTTCEAQVSTKKEESEGEKGRERQLKKELPCRKRRKGREERENTLFPRERKKNTNKKR